MASRAGVSVSTSCDDAGWVDAPSTTRTASQATVAGDRFSIFFIAPPSGVYSVYGTDRLSKMINLGVEVGVELDDTPVMLNVIAPQWSA